MRLRMKLVASFAIIAILISTAGYLGSNQLSNLASAYYVENEQLLPALSSLDEVKEKLPIIELEPLEYIQKPDSEHLEELDEAEEVIHDALMKYGKIAGELTAAGLQQDIDELFGMSRAIIELRDNNAPRDVLEQDFGNLDDKLDEFRNNLDVERARITDQLTLSVGGLKEEIRSIFLLTIILSVVAAAIAIAVTIYLSYSISKPISKLKEAADQIGKGNYAVDTMVSRNSDEKGELCVHFGKMKDDLKNKEKLQNDFINIASHELRTPVQPILSYVDLASKGLVRPEQALKVIGVQGKRLQHLTNDILDVSRIESGRLTYDKDKVELNELISDVVNTLKLSVNTEELALVTRLNAPTGVAIYADEMRMRQVLNNIIGNAVKFTRKGQVTIQTDYMANNRKLVEITVADNGPGISKDVVANLFGKFVTKDIRTEAQQGTGLGLFISNAIIQAHDGSITARNNDNGQGCTFTIALPLYTMDTRKEEDSVLNM